MRVRVYLIIIGVFLITFTAFGMITKQSMIPLSYDELINRTRAGVFPDELQERNLLSMEESLDEQEYILTVKCVSEPSFLYANAMQEVEIIKVHKGAFKIGDHVNVMMVLAMFSNENGLGFKPDSLKEINMGFTNFMKIGETYLIFMEKEINIGIVKYPVLCRSEDYLVNPIFPYTVSNTKPIKSTMHSVYKAVSLADLQDYDFFFEEKGCEHILQLMDKVIKKYQ